ncbi:response regulator (plasmid) [Deinococcus taeanensis]|uniref:response regulator n=1 Tax=Deinococcus taeanensis TaxID=2737050 RepID=UPI001CDD8C03|nr:response regulator [Deinococcus taeanensis]UBV45413.1 response regulator [Deinococcus taeanensis]
MPSGAHETLSLMVVDDHEPDRMLVEEAFALLPYPVRIYCCSTGPEALAWLRDPARPRPDVILLDLNMPLMTGFDVLQAIRDDPALSAQPVVILSTSDVPDDIRRAYHLRAGAYCVKRVDFAGLLQQVEAMVRFWQHARFPHWPAGQTAGASEA